MPRPITAPWLTRWVLRHSSTIALGVLVVSAEGPGQFTSGVQLVEVYASVTDDKGNAVQGLGRDDFVVLEDGTPQQVSAFAAGDFPLSVALAIDRSFSMSGDRLAAAKSAGRLFLGALRPGDQAVLLAIGSTVDVVAPLSTDRAAQYAALSALDAFGTTGLHDAIIRAIDLTGTGSGRRALVLLSDGADRYSQASADDAVQASRTSDVMIYPIAFGRARPPLFAELAAISGGRSFHVRDARDLGPTLTTIAEDLRHQYLLGYVPSRSLATGTGQWRAIEVKVNRSGVRVRARSGYAG